MKHKKRLMLMLLVIAAVMLCSCSNSKNGSETTEPETSGDSMNVVISYESDTEATTDTDTPEETNVIPWFQEILNKTYPTKEGADENSVSYLIKDGVVYTSVYDEKTETFTIKEYKDDSVFLYRLTNGFLSSQNGFENIPFIEGITGITVDTFSVPDKFHNFALDRPNNIQNYYYIGQLEKPGTSSSYKTIDGVLYSLDGKTLVAFPAGRTGEYTVPDGVEKIADNAFDYSRLTKVTLPSSVKDVGKAFEKAEHIKIVR